MERMILDTIKHARDVSKKGMGVKFILRRISKTSGANLDEDVIKIEIMEMINKRIIEKSYKILNEHGLQQTNRQIHPRRSERFKRSKYVLYLFILTDHQQERLKIKKLF